MHGPPPPHILPNQAASKRYKVTGSGKVMARHAGKQHMNEKMTRKGIRESSKTWVRAGGRACGWCACWHGAAHAGARVLPGAWGVLKDAAARTRRRHAGPPRAARACIVRAFGSAALIQPSGGAATLPASRNGDHLAMGAGTLLQRLLLTCCERCAARRFVLSKTDINNVKACLPYSNVGK